MSIIKNDLKITMFFDSKRVYFSALSLSQNQMCWCVMEWGENLYLIICTSTFGCTFSRFTMHGNLSFEEVSNIQKLRQAFPMFLNEPCSNCCKLFSTGDRIIWIIVFCLISWGEGLSWGTYSIHYRCIIFVDAFWIHMHCLHFRSGLSWGMKYSSFA